MPRGSSRKNANQHNNRHENGVVAPGKRVVKQKSNGHLANGTPEGNPRANTPPVPSPSASSNPITLATVSATANGSASASPSPLPRQDSRNQSAADEVLNGPRASEHNMGPSGEQNHRKIDVGAARPSAAHDGAGIIPLALTVLSSCPLRDTLAILIVLLSLPSALITVTNAMFAFLTFVPPSGSFTVMPTLTDITSSFSPGTPSFIVICLIDFLSMALWLFLPREAQALVLDSAQAMVATTLGGGYSYKPGAKDNTLLCVLIVISGHISQYQPLLLQRLNRTYLRRWTPPIEQFDADLFYARYPVGSSRSWWDTIKVTIAIHIVCQGLTRMVRRFLYSARTAPSTRSIDIEPSVSHQTGSELPDHNATDLKSRSSVQNMRDLRDKVSSGKRRRKQANYVRSQQPFWAAFAATKATIMREFDLSRANADAVHSHATGKGDFGSMPFATTENRVWITGVQENGFFFETSHFGNVGEDGSIKPLYIRCNSMEWSSVKLEPIPDTDDAYSRTQWLGEVYGLSSGKTYQVCFSHCEDDTLIHSETIATLSSPQPENPTPTSATFQPPRPSSPASPIATLENSIAAFEGSLSDISTQQRRIRKENKANTNALRREIELLGEKLARNSNTDKNLQTRQTQQSQHMRQADEAITAIGKELDAYAALPEEDTKEWSTRKESLHTARNEQASAREDLIRSKETKHRLYTARQSEEMNARHKRERLQSRLDRISKQYKRLNSPPATPEKSRSNSDQSFRLPDRSVEEERYQDQINVLQRAFAQSTLRVNTCYAQIQALENAAEQAAIHARSNLARSPGGHNHNSNHSNNQNNDHNDSRPITPEGNLPGTQPHSATSANFNHRFDSAPFSNGNGGGVGIGGGGIIGGLGALGTRPDTFHRQRSLSGDGGGFLDFDDDELVPAKVKRRSGFGSVREGSEGSGGSGSGSPHVRYRSKQ